MSNARIVNLTSRVIMILADDGCYIPLRSDGIAPRVKLRKELVGSLPGVCQHAVPMYRISYGEVFGMPSTRENTFYVVSSIVAQALKAEGRTDDILVVDDAIMDEADRIIGYRGLAHV